MHANLRGNVIVKGMSIENFIRKIVSEQPTSSQEPVVKDTTIDVEAVINKKLQPLQTFQDEKNVMTDALANLVERVSHLESSTAAVPQAPTPVDFKQDIDALIASMEKLEKKVTDMKPRRGVDQSTLDTAIANMDKTVDSKINVVTDSLAELRKELEE